VADIAENLLVNEASRGGGTFTADDVDGQTAQNNFVHVVMVPRREPVKIGNSDYQQN